MAKFKRGHVVLRFVLNDVAFAKTLDEIESVDKNEIVSVQELGSLDEGRKREWLVIIKTDVAE